MRRSWRRCATTRGRTSTIARCRRSIRRWRRLAFAATPSLWAWKLLVALGDAAVGAPPLYGAVDPRRLVLWAWSPLVVIELGLNAHVDALGVALLIGALLAWQRGRAAAAGALAAAAAAVKLLPAVALLGMRRRRAVVAAAVVAVVLALPYAAAGPRMAGSLGEYSRRWRVNDGAFALLYAGAERAGRAHALRGAVRHGRFAAAGAPGDRARSRHALSRRGRQLRRARVGGRDLFGGGRHGRCGDAPPRCN